MKKMNKKKTTTTIIAAATMMIVIASAAMILGIQSQTSHNVLAQSSGPTGRSSS